MGGRVVNPPDRYVKFGADREVQQSDRKQTDLVLLGWAA